MSVFAGTASIFANTLGRAAQYIAPGGDTGVDCLIIVSSAHGGRGGDTARHPQLAGKVDSVGYKISVQKSEIGAPCAGGSFVEKAPLTGTYTIVGKPVVEIENPDLWICQAA